MEEKSGVVAFRKEAERWLGSALACVVYAVGVNLFLVPAGLYTGGLMGFCQIIRTVLVDYLHFSFGELDIAGIVYYIINIPIFLLAFPHMEKRFFLRTFFSTTVTSLALSLIPSTVVLEDTLAATIVGAVISGAGTGFLLRMSSAGGGMDVVGMVLSKTRKDMSVGRVNLFLNIALYAICLFLFDIVTVIYSALYAAVYSFVLDQVHIQNINVEVKIITRIDPTELEQEVLTHMERGVTELQSVGAYTHEQSHMLYILVSKFEIPQLRSIVRKHDPHAFIVICEGIRVDGNYLKKL